jgi:hypothetical protein
MDPGGARRKLVSLIEINRNPSRKELVWFGVLLAVFCAFLGAVFRWRFHAPDAGRAAWVAGAVLTAIYFAAPPLRRWIYLGWTYAAYPIGWTVSHLTLAIVYYLVLTPIGLIIRMTRRDPLDHRFEPSRRSYWSEHAPSEDPSRYFRQY